MDSYALERDVSLDLRLGDGMSFKTHLQVIDAEATYDTLVRMDFMENNCVNSEFYSTQKGFSRGWILTYSLISLGSKRISMVLNQMKLK